jgi:hypothetical protein
MAKNEWESAPIDKSDPTNLLVFGSRTGSVDNFNKLDPALRQNLIDAAEAYYQRTGKKLQVNSSFRSVEDQKRLYDESVKAGRPGIGPTGMPIAKPGRSRHQSAMAIDIQQGKSDPVAREILGQYGLVQTVKNDPVHFEMAPIATGAPAQPQPVQAQPVQEPVQAQPVQAPPPAPQPRQRGRIGPQPGGFMGAEGPGPTISDIANAIRQGGQNLATLVNPMVRGATFGTSVYPEAAIRQQPGETYEQALARTRQIYEQQGQAFPGFQIAGELAGGVASGVGAGAALTKAAAPVAGSVLAPIIGQGAAGAAGAGLTTYTARPETTATEAGIAAGIGGAIGGGATAATALGSKLVNTVGSRVVRENVEGALAKLESPNAAERRDAAIALNAIFGDRFRQFKNTADRPQWRSIIGVDNPAAAKEIAKNMTIADFARMSTESIDNLNFARTASAAAGTAPRAGAQAEQQMATALRMRTLLQGTQAGQQMIPTTLSGLGGALIGGAMGYDPTTTGFGGALAGAVLGPAMARGAGSGAGVLALTPSFQRAMTQVGPVTQAIATPATGQVAKVLTAPQAAQPVNEWESAPIAKD